jgi:hypothetical protein
MWTNYWILFSRDFINTIVLKVDLDDPRERLKRARQLRLKRGEQEAAEAKKKSKFVSSLPLMA